jgi:hypothetical protein
MRATAQSRYLTVTIDRNVDEAYAFLCKPGSLSKWASGLGELTQTADGWVAQTPDGPISVEFCEPNEFGVLDHWVCPTPDVNIYIPLRVIRNGEGCELVFTLFRLPDMSDEKFASDAEWVMRDLEMARRVLEAERV